MQFSEPVEVASATVAANYVVTNGTLGNMGVSGAFRVNDSLVGLTLNNPLVSGATYYVVVNNVRDRSTTPITIAPNSVRSFTYAVPTTSAALIEFFTGISGTTVPNLTADLKYINQTPDSVAYTTNQFAHSQALANTIDNYGVRITSYFVPPSNGVYRFYIRSDDLSQLSMNTNNGAGTDRSRLAVVASTPNCCQAYTNASPYVTTNFSLIGGQKYFMEALMKEGGGGDGFTMMWRETNTTLVFPPANTEAASNLTAVTALELPTGNMAISTITPSSITVSENVPTTTIFTVSGVTGAGPVKYQWLRNGQVIPGATGFIYTNTSGLAGGETITFAASNLFSVGTISPTINIINPDTVAPTLLSVRNRGSATNVVVAFSERVTQASANDTNNYQIPGLLVLTATLQSDATNVVLRTTPQTESQQYTMTVSNIRDISGAANTINPTSLSFGYAFAGGLVKEDFFTNITGTAVANLTSTAAYQANAANYTFYTNIFNFGARTVDATGLNGWNTFINLNNTTMENYGTRFSGWFTAPSNGVYKFFIRSDDFSTFSMNTNALDATDPSGAVVIAQVTTGCCRNYGDTAGGPSVSVPITLVGGRKYYTEALLKEGTGGDGFTMTYRDANATDLPPNNESALGRDFSSLANLYIAGAPTVNIVAQPVNAPDTLENRTATFSVTATNSIANGPIGFQWQKNGVDIPNATAARYTTPPLAYGDVSTYRVKIAIPGVGAVAFSVPATVNVLQDTQPPTLVGAFGDPASRNLRLVFNETVSLQSATNTANYSFSGAPNITNATLLQDRRTVLLTVDNPIVSGQYTIAAFNIADVAATPNTAALLTSGQFTAPWAVTNGVIQRQIYLGNSGVNNFQTITNNPKFPNNPDTTDYLTSFYSPASSPNVDNYTTRLTGYIIPTVSGNYAFRIRSDDSGMISMSQDADPANLRQIVVAEGSCGGCGTIAPGATIPTVAPGLNVGNAFGPIPMVAGRAYYFEGLAQEGGGGDYLEVMWVVPGTTTTNTVPAANIAYSINPDTVTLAITSNPTNMEVFERRTATFRSSASGTGPLRYQWERSEDGGNTWFDIGNATNNTYSITPLDYNVDNQVQFRMRAFLSGGLIQRTVWSDPALLTVNDDAVGPVLLKAYSLSGTTIKLLFDEDLDYNTVTDLPSYDPVEGINVVGAVLMADNNGVSNTVLLTLETPLLTSSFMVSGSTTDGVGNGGQFSGPGKVVFLGMGLTDDGPLGNLPADPIEKGRTTTDLNRLEFVAGGSDIWNAVDGGRFAWGDYTGDFDVKVRITRLDALDRWSKAGIAVRDDLTPGSHNINAVLTPFSGSTNAVFDGMGANDFEAGIRATTGAGTTDWGNYVGIRPTNAAPFTNAWIRLQRAANVFTAFYATNGSPWIQYATTNHAFPTTVKLALASTAHQNAVGQTTTAVFEDFARVLPPTIVTPPISQSVTQGGTATFSVVVSGEAPFGYQWRKDGNVITDATNASLTIMNAQAGDEADYDVVVTNIKGNATSDIAHLTVILRPTIPEDQPADVTVACQGMASFTVSPGGTAPFAYQWYKGATLLTGETNATLTFDPVTPASNGVYKVVVTNAAGTVTSREAQLTVTDTAPPTITLVGDSAMIVECHSIFMDPGATASDACEGNLTSQIVVSGSVNPNVPGPYTLRYNVMDSSGNPATEKTRSVTVVDTVRPNISACPADKAVCTGSNSAVVTFTKPLATDDCDAGASVQCVPASGSNFDIGTTIVTCTASDASGNTNACTFNVVVTKADQPTLTAIGLSGTTFTANFASENNCHYVFESKDSFDQPTWDQIQVVTGTGGVMTVTDTQATVSSRVYRLRVQ